MQTTLFCAYSTLRLRAYMMQNSFLIIKSLTVFYHHVYVMKSADRRDNTELFSSNFQKEFFFFKLQKRNSMNFIKRCVTLQVVDVLKTAGIAANNSGLSFSGMTIGHDNNPCHCPAKRQLHLGGIGLLLKVLLCSSRKP